MDIYNEYLVTPSPSGIVSVLADFVRLAQHILGGSTPASPERSAHTLLAHLLHLCKLQRGALLLSTLPRSESERFCWSLLAERKMLRILARQEINDDDLFALLTTFSGHQNEQSQMIAFDAGWLICQGVIPAYDSLHYNNDSQDNRLQEPSNAAPFSSTFRFFVLGATDKQALAGQASLEDVQVVWSLVSDAVGLVIISLLQAERMAEMATTMSHHDLQPAQVLNVELLATISHELCNPLATMKGYAATLLRHGRHISWEESHEFLQAIYRAGQRLEDVIDQLLVISQLGTVALPLQRAPVSLVHLAREAINAIEQHPDEVEVINPVLQVACQFTLRIEDCHGLSTGEAEVPLLQADRRLLRVALDYLLENAVHYSPEGGRVEIGLRTVEPDQVHLLTQTLPQMLTPQGSAMVFSPSWLLDQPMVEVWIRDQGIGIPEAHLEQIFHRFYQVDTGRGREADGLELGLTICKQIVQLHSGILWAESEMGKGSTFHMLFPINGYALS